MGRIPLLRAVAITSGVLYGIVGGAADSGVSDASFSAAVGLFDKAKAALECNVCKVIADNTLQ